MSTADALQATGLTFYNRAYADQRSLSVAIAALQNISLVARGGPEGPRARILARRALREIEAIRARAAGAS